jgi:hypothetical protein
LWTTTGKVVPTFLWILVLGAIIAVVRILLRREPENGSAEETAAPMRVSLRLVFAVPLVPLAAYILLGWNFTVSEGVAILWVFVIAVGWESLIIGRLRLMGFLGKLR